MSCDSGKDFWGLSFPAVKNNPEAFIPEIIHEKVIYPSKKPLTEEEIKRVLNMEIETFKRVNSDYVYSGYTHHKGAYKTVVCQLKFIHRKAFKGERNGASAN